MDITSGDLGYLVMESFLLLGSQGHGDRGRVTSTSGTGGGGSGVPHTQCTAVFVRLAGLNLEPKSWWC